MKKTLTALACLFLLSASAQKGKSTKAAPPPASNAAAQAQSGGFNTTIFYSKDMREVKEKGSMYYLLINMAANGLPQGKARLLRTKDDKPVWEGEYFLFNKLEPEKSRYNGLCTWYYDNGQKWRESNFRNGLPEGKTTLYAEDGRPQYAGSYKGGKMAGLMTYYESGNPAGRAAVSLFDAVYNDEWVERTGDGEALVDGGQLLVSTKAKDGYIKKEPLAIDYSRDFSIDLHFRFKGPEVVVLYGHRDTANYNAITVSSKGFIRPEMWVGGADKGSGQTFKVAFSKDDNILRILRTGDDLFFSMNGNMVTSVKYTRFPGNGFGFYLPGKSSQMMVSAIIAKELGRGKTALADEEEKPAVKKATEGKWQPVATAVFVAPNYLATTYSTVKDKEQIGVVQLRNGVRAVVNAKVVAQDEDMDMALLQVEDPKFGAPGALPYTLANGDVETGEAVFTLGYPLSNPTADDIRVTEGIISGTSGPNGDDRSYNLSSAVNRFNNGGPVFNKNGNLVGLASLSLSQQGGSGYAVKTFSLLNLLEGVKASSKAAAGQALKGKPLKEQLRLLRSYVVEVCVK